MTRRHDAPYLRSLRGFDDKDNVEVKRENHHDGWYADITVGFKAEKVLLIIENKVVGWYPEAEEQARAYQEALRKKYERQQYEAGERRLDVVEFIEIARAIGFDPGEFISRFTNEMTALDAAPPCDPPQPASSTKTPI